ncbi:hypothetical protein HPB47_005819, partial [Ixodes persulcatus]
DTRLREAGAEAVYCLARGAPKGPNKPRAQLNHQGPLFPGQGYATHSQTWVGEPTWLGSCAARRSAVAVHVGINNTNTADSAITRIARFRQLVSRVLKVDPEIRITFTAIPPKWTSLLRISAGFRQEQNRKARETNFYLQELCRKEGHGFIDGTSQDWNGMIKAEDVHFNKRGSKAAKKKKTDQAAAKKDSYEAILQNQLSQAHQKNSRISPLTQKKQRASISTSDSNDSLVSSREVQEARRKTTYWKARCKELREDNIFLQEQVRAQQALLAF